MSRYLLILLALALGLVFSQKAEAQQVCGPNGCYEVQFQPVRATLDRTFSVVENVVTDMPPVPVTYSVANHTVNRGVALVRTVRTKLLRPVLSRVVKPLRKLFCR